MLGIDCNLGEFLRGKIAHTATPHSRAKSTLKVDVSQQTFTFKTAFENSFAVITSHFGKIISGRGKQLGCTVIRKASLVCFKFNFIQH